MRERPLVWFTVLCQAAVGTCLAANAVRWGVGKEMWESFGRLTSAWTALLGCIALAVSLLHLGRPFRAARALSNLSSSWLSREILCVLIFCTGSMASAIAHRSTGQSLSLLLALDGACALAGVCLVVTMFMAYRLRTVAQWNTWRTPAAFLLTTLGLGAFLSFVIALLSAVDEDETFVAWSLVILLLLGLATALHGKKGAWWRALSALLTLLAVTAHLLAEGPVAIAAVPALFGLCCATVAELRNRSQFYALRDTNL